MHVHVHVHTCAHVRTSARRGTPRGRGSMLCMDMYMYIHVHMCAHLREEGTPRGRGSMLCMDMYMYIHAHVRTSARRGTPRGRRCPPSRTQTRSPQVGPRGPSRDTGPAQTARACLAPWRTGSRGRHLGRAPCPVPRIPSTPDCGRYCLSGRDANGTRTVRPWAIALIEHAPAQGAYLPRVHPACESDGSSAGTL